MMRRILAMFAIAASMVIGAAIPANAASIVVSPSRVAVSNRVTVSGDVLVNGHAGCGLPGTVTLISGAFRGHREFAGEGAVFATADTSGHFSASVVIAPSISPGTYRITGRCGGGNLGVVAALTVRGLPRTGASIGPLSDAQAIAIGLALVLCGTASARLARRRRIA